MDNPHEFWGLNPGHPVHEDGVPHDEVVGDYHVKFSTMTHGVSLEQAPSYEIHDANHVCVGHMHEYSTAKILCAVLSANVRGFSAGTYQDWVRAGITKEDRYE